MLLIVAPTTGRRRFCVALMAKQRFSGFFRFSFGIEGGHSAIETAAGFLSPRRSSDRWDWKNKKKNNSRGAWCFRLVPRVFACTFLPLFKAPRISSDKLPHWVRRSETAIAHIMHKISFQTIDREKKKMILSTLSKSLSAYILNVERHLQNRNNIARFSWISRGSRRQALKKSIFFSMTHIVGFMENIFHSYLFQF